MKAVRLNITKTIRYERIASMSQELIDKMCNMSEVDFNQFILEKMLGPGVRTDSDSHDAEYEIL